MTGAAEIQIARKAKDKLLRECEGNEWFRGAGIVPSGSGFALRLNVDPSAKPSAAALPAEVDGVPVDIVYTAGYSRRS